jgi:hypothetical protein
MATTTNFGWATPNDTDLVKDGAAAIRTLGSSIDTSFVDLKGGTTGQVLAKASGADLDYSWTTLASGGMTSIASGSLSTASGTLSLSSIAGTYKNLQLVVRDWYPTTNGAGVTMTANSVTSYDYATIFAVADNSTIQSDSQVANAAVFFHYNSVKNVDANNVFILNIFDYANTSSAKTFSSIMRYTNESTSIGQVGITNGAINTASAITSINWGLSAGSGNFAQGTYVLYGVN